MITGGRFLVDDKVRGGGWRENNVFPNLASSPLNHPPNLQVCNLPEKSSSEREEKTLTFFYIFNFRSFSSYFQGIQYLIRKGLS
jgi:hypothetical protein